MAANGGGRGQSRHSTSRRGLFDCRRQSWLSRGILCSIIALTLTGLEGHVDRISNGGQSKIVSTQRRHYHGHHQTHYFEPPARSKGIRGWALFWTRDAAHCTEREM